MHVKSEGIVLQNIKYGDKKSILKVFTKNYGLVTLFAAAGKSPTSKIKIASILPLYQVELSFILKQNREVQQLTESNILYIYEGISRDYIKLAIAQFLNEVLIKTIKEHTPNEEMFSFVTSTYQWLNESNAGYSNVHIYFLHELSRYLGFEPHNNYSIHECYFDAREGKFSQLAMSFPLGFNKEQSLLFAKCLNSDILTSQLNRQERNEILECLLALYRMHISGFNELKSFDVLKQLFD